MRDYLTLTLARSLLGLTPRQPWPPEWPKVIPMAEAQSLTKALEVWGNKDCNQTLLMLQLSILFCNECCCV